MTVSSTTNRKSFAGDGVTTSFGTSPVVFFNSSELVVQVITTATGAATTLVENTNYTVSGGSGSTGTVNLAGGTSPNGAPSASQTLLIRRVLPLTQTDDFVNNDINDAEVTEDRFDKTVMQIQQLDEELGRGLTIPASETATDALTVLPFDRASKFLAFDASKNPIASPGPAGDNVPVSSFMATVLDDTTAAAARTTLDVPSNSEAILDTIIDAKGDLIVGTAADTPARKAVGSNGTLLLADSSQSDGLQWAGGFSRKNIIIGGNFTTNPWQRGTSFTGPATGSYTADRWRLGFSGAAVVNILKTADAPTAAEAGIYSTHCFHVDVTTADASLAAGDQLNISQRVEGLNIAHMGFGQSGTRYLTLSFWHKHTKTGVYCVGLQNSAANRSYVAEYTQDVSDTWEKATVTFAVDTGGTWLYDTGVGLNVVFCMAAGTDFQTTAGAWAAGNYFATANQVNGLDSTSNNFKLALIQLEAGTVATEFENLDHGSVIAACRRYLPAFNGGSDAVIGNGWVTAASQVISVIPFSVEARVPPTGITVANAANSKINHLAGAVATINSASFFNASNYSGSVLVNTSTSPFTGGQGATWSATNSDFQLLFTGCEL